MRSAPSRAVPAREATNGSPGGARAVSTNLRPSANDRGVAEVVGHIVGNLNSLARAEARLAVVELVGGLTDRAKGAATGAGIAAGGALLGLLAIGGLLAAGAAALSLVMAAWLAILLVAVVTGVAAWITASLGARQLRRALNSPSPKHSHASKDAKEHG